MCSLPSFTGLFSGESHWDLVLFAFFKPAVKSGTIKAGDLVFEREAHFDELVANFIHRLLTEVTDVHQLVLGESNQFAHVVDTFTLQAVVAANRKVKALDGHSHFAGENYLYRCWANFDTFSFCVQVAGEAKELDKGATGGSYRIARAHRRLGFHIHHKTVEVSALTGTSCLDAVGHLQHG